MQKIFKNLKVVELANVLAGPAVGMFFAELGAKVIKVENKLTNGDITRSWKLPTEKKSSKTSAYYQSANWGKQSLLLDLTTTRDKLRVMKMIGSADIVITNYKAGDAQKLGFDYKAVKKINSEIIYAHISGFGSNNKRVAFDLVLQAESGFLSMNGSPESGPVKLPVALIDILAAHQIKEAVLIALLNRLKTGRGAYVETSLYESAIASLANQGTNWLLAGHNPERLGTLHPNIAPYGEMVVSKDNRQIILAVGSDKQFYNLCKALKSEHLATDKRFNTNANRIKNRKLLLDKLKVRFSHFKAGSILASLNRYSVPAAEIKSLKDVFSTPLARKMIIQKGKKPIGLRTIAFKIKAVNNKTV